MSKKFKISCLIILILSLFIFSGVKAESGWDGSYDSGSSSSSDWGSSSSSDWGSSSNWSSSSDRNSSSSSSGIYIGNGSGFIIWIIIIIVVVLITSNSNNKNSNTTNNIPSTKPLIPFDTNKIKEILPDFSKEQFKNQSYEIYKNIQEAWMNFDYDNLKKYTTDELYNTYKSQLVALGVKKQKNIMKDFVLKDFEITNMETNSNIISLTVRMIIECFDYVVDENNITLRGNSHKKVRYDYEMIFIKGMSKNKNKCPNCNAPLEESNRNECPYCNSVIISKNYNWVLSKKRVISQTENVNR